MTGQVALITGSSRGIGLAAAVALAKAGFDIALNTLTEGDELEEAAALVRSEGRRVFKAVMDVAQIDSHKAVLDAVEAELGPLTTLVNNAGVGVINRGDPLDVTEESFDRCLSVNAKAMFFLTQAFAKRLLDREQVPSLNYSVINVTSSNAIAVAVARGEYCASKAAAAMISKVFAVRLGAHGIAVFDVQPGLIATDMTQPVIADYEKRAEDGLCVIPRVGQPEEVGQVITTLATNGLPYATGHVISVDGGLLIQKF